MIGSLSLEGRCHGHLDHAVPVPGRPAPPPEPRRRLPELRHGPVLPHAALPGARPQARLRLRGAPAGAEAGRASSQTEDCQRLLRLLGVPYLQAPGEGEALCAQLAKGGLVHAVASEDMDTLAFGGSLLVRQLNASKSGEVVEYSLPKVLEILGLTQEQFVDLCILLGCDFCEKIRGLGPRKALDLIRKHKTIENVVLHINREVHPIPLCWKYQEARSLFLEAAGGYGGGQALSWTEPDEEGLVTFLCRERHMKEERVRRRLERFRAGLLERETEREEAGGGPAGRQTSLTQFFRVTRRRQAPDAEEAEGSCKKPRAQ
ncbi:probable flap endonuclease 1 homolog isoform X4 [Lepisosteus oculatus]|uniref:probable flap endonuclease 1 homolog isoform X4 n=1 Tax=Lepisosteus oculatus TaxID=7918 RepID=UPI0035F52303